MDIEGNYFYITPDELEAATFSGGAAAANRACTTRNHVRHNQDWHFRVDIEHFDDFITGLAETAELPPYSGPSFMDRIKQEKGQKISKEILSILFPGETKIPLPG